MIFQFNDKTCGDCGKSFSPHSGHQKWCDDCRAIREEAKTKTNGKRAFSTKICEECKETFIPHGPRQKWCDICRDMAVVNEMKTKNCEDCGKAIYSGGSATPMRSVPFLAMQPKTKDCEGCGKNYLPNSAQQKLCDDCREKERKRERTSADCFC